VSCSRIWHFVNSWRCSSDVIRAQGSGPSTGSSGCSFVAAGRDGNKHSLSSSLKLLSAGTAGWAEIPLLAHHLSQCAFPVRRPSQHKFLRTTHFLFLKYERDAFKFLWPIKD